MGTEIAMSPMSKVIFTVTTVTGLATAAFIVLYQNCGFAWSLTTAITCGTTFYHFAMRLLVGAVVPKLIGNANGRWFRQCSFEPALYRFLCVRQWKKYMPTYNPDSFSLRHHTLPQIIKTSRHSEVVHEVIIVFSFLPLLFIRPFGAGAVFVTTSLLAALFDSCFVIMQRYNRPRLERLYKKEETRP